MKNWFYKILATYDYHGFTSFFESMAPSVKYSLTKHLLFVSCAIPGFQWLAAFFPAVPLVMGIQAAALIGMLLAFIAELSSGIIASQIRGEQFSSFRLSRFSFKVFIYLILIAVPYHWSQSFAAQNKTVMAVSFDWLQSFLIVHIALENLVSILENLAVIDGKDKTAWINAIKDRLTKKIP